MLEVTGGGVKLYGPDGELVGEYATSTEAIEVASGMEDGNYVIKHNDASIEITVPDGPVEPPVEPPIEPPEPGDTVKIRFSLDDHIGAPMEGVQLPRIVVFNTEGYHSPTAAVDGATVGHGGEVDINLGDSTGLSDGDIVWIACAEAIGTYGTDGYQTNGFITQVVVEAV